MQYLELSDEPIAAILRGLNVVIDHFIKQQLNIAEEKLKSLGDSATALEKWKLENTIANYKSYFGDDGKLKVFHSHLKGFNAELGNFILILFENENIENDYQGEAKKTAEFSISVINYPASHNEIKLIEQAGTIATASILWAIENAINYFKNYELNTNGLRIENDGKITKKTIEIENDQNSSKIFYFGSLSMEVVYNVEYIDNDGIKIEAIDNIVNDITKFNVRSNT